MDAFARAGTKALIVIVNVIGGDYLRRAMRSFIRSGFN
jgi:hypothetical protein